MPKYSDERSAIKALSIAIVLSMLSQFTVSSVFLTYSGDILSRTGNNVNPYTASIIFGVIQIVASLFTTQLADRLGRKVLLTVSLLGTVLGQVALSSFTYLHILGHDLSFFSWIPVISISFVVFISTLGIIPLASVCTVEVLPAKVGRNSTSEISDDEIDTNLNFLTFRFVRLAY